MTWLDCDTETEAGSKQADTKKLKCSICSKFRGKIVRSWNSGEKWIAGQTPCAQ